MSFFEILSERWMDVREKREFNLIDLNDAIEEDARHVTMWRFLSLKNKYKINCSGVKVFFRI